MVNSSLDSMNRREFFKRLFIGFAAVVAAPKIIGEINLPDPDHIVCKGMPDPEVFYYTQMSYEDFKDMCDLIRIKARRGGYNYGFRSSYGR
jgi:hypothetical protein